MSSELQGAASAIFGLFVMSLIGCWENIKNAQNMVQRDSMFCT